MGQRSTSIKYKFRKRRVKNRQNRYSPSVYNFWRSNMLKIQTFLTFSKHHDIRHKIFVERFDNFSSTSDSSAPNQANSILVDFDSPRSKLQRGFAGLKIHCKNTMNNEEKRRKLLKNALAAKTTKTNKTNLNFWATIIDPAKNFQRFNFRYKSIFKIDALRISTFWCPRDRPNF